MIIKELNKRCDDVTNRNVEPIKSQPKFDTDEWLVLRDAKFMEWFEDESAVQFAQIVSQSTELFDDILDRDVAIGQDHIFNLMHSLWITLPDNKFWAAYRLFLTPVLLMSLNAWLVANKLEDGSSNDRVYAYTTRNLTLQIFPMMVYALHGENRMRELSMDMHQFFTEHETLDEYLDKTDTIYAKQGEMK